MSHEKPISVSKKSVLGKVIYDIGAEAASLAIGPLVRHWTETIDNGTKMEYAPDFDDKFAEAVEDGCLIVYEANHASNYDAEVLALVNDQTQEATNTQEALLPMAKSQMTGDQGFWPFVMYKSTRKLLKKHHLRPIPTATQNDTALRNMDSNHEEYALSMTCGVKEGTTAIAVLPEASVAGGRINPQTGQLNGMIPFDPNVLRMNYILARRNHRILAVEPIAIRNSNEVLNPNTKFPKGNALRAGLHLGDPHIVDVYVCAPLRSDRELAPFIRNHDWKGASDHIGREIAKHLPKPQQGVYAESQPATLQVKGLPLRI